MSALRGLPADDHQRRVVRQRAATRPAVEDCEPATDHVRILEDAIVAPELTEGAEVDGAIGREHERLNFARRHGPMNVEGQALAHSPRRGARKEGVAEIGWRVVWKRT